jgi:hypothetical protein
MRNFPERSRFGFSLIRILFAGLAGGIAEILWIGVWSAATPLQLTTVASEITRTVFPGMAETVIATETGLMIHLVISMAIGLAFVWALEKHLARHYGGIGILVGSVTLLTLIWTINFLVVLPVLNPAFVTLMPYTVSLGSKTLFGLAMGAVLIASSHTARNARIMGEWIKRNA